MSHKKSPERVFTFDAVDPHLTRMYFHPPAAKTRDSGTGLTAEDITALKALAKMTPEISKMLYAGPAKAEQKEGLPGPGDSEGTLDDPSAVDPPQRKPINHDIYTTAPVEEKQRKTLDQAQQSTGFGIGSIYTTTDDAPATLPKLGSHASTGLVYR
jgi:hypothetical protein